MNITQKFFTVMLLSIVSSGILANGNSTFEKFYIVDGVNKVIKRNDIGSNTVPWELTGTDKTRNGFDGEVITVTHGCYFYDIEYHIYNSTKADKKVTVRAQPGEFCDLQNLVFSHPTLIKVKFWGGVGYLLEHAPLIFDDNNNAYVAGIDLPPSWGMGGLLEHLSVKRIEKDTGFCKNKESLSYSDIEFMTSSKYIAELGGKICHSYVLPIDKITQNKNK